MQSIEHLLLENPVFGSLQPARRQQLASLAVPRRLQKGEIISCAGDLWPYLFLIEKGSVSAHKQSLEGRSLTVTTFASGDIFWGLAFFYEHMPQPVTLTADSPSVLLQWRAEDLRPFFQQDPGLGWELARLMILKMKVANEILEELAFQPVVGRLAKLLLEVGPQGAGQQVVTRSLTLDEMAARIGSTREMVCRFLHRFADDGIIEITRTEYRIADPQRLNEVSKFSKG